MILYCSNQNQAQRENRDEYISILVDEESRKIIVATTKYQIDDNAILYPVEDIKILDSSDDLFSFVPQDLYVLFLARLSRKLPLYKSLQDSNILPKVTHGLEALREKLLLLDDSDAQTLVEYQIPHTTLCLSGELDPAISAPIDWVANLNSI